MSCPLLKEVSKEKSVEFQFHGSFRSNLERRALREHPKYFIVDSKERGTTSEISLSEELFDMKTRNHRGVSVLKRYLFVFITT